MQPRTYILSKSHTHRHTYTSRREIQIPDNEGLRNDLKKFRIMMTLTPISRLKFGPRNTLVIELRDSAVYIYMSI